MNLKRTGVTSVVLSFCSRPSLTFSQGSRVERREQSPHPTWAVELVQLCLAPRYRAGVRWNTSVVKRRPAFQNHLEGEKGLAVGLQN